MEVAIRLDRSAGLHGQIYRQLRDAVLGGRLRPGEVLPSSRELAGQLRVSRNTVTPKLVWEAQGVRVIGVPVDEQGLIVDALPPDARMVYVTPSHQYPTGVALSLRRRAELLAWAQRHDAAIVENDYDSEFRYPEQQLEPLHNLDRSGRVLYVGSFSKVLLPARCRSTSQPCPPRRACT